MKTYISILVLLGTFFISCSDDNTEQIDFSGNYIGNFDCIGSLEDDNGNSFTVSISKVNNSENEYLISLEDDVEFLAISSDDQLTINRQVFNEDLGFDVITFAGMITSSEEENTLNFDFTHQVDDEGESTCNTVLTLQ